MLSYSNITSYRQKFETKRIRDNTIRKVYSGCKVVSYKAENNENAPLSAATLSHVMTDANTTCLYVFDCDAQVY